MNSSAVFKEDVDIVPVIIDDTLSYMPWGGDNNMPFDILKLIEDDETLSTCQMFNAEVCFGSGLRYDTCLAAAAVKSEVEDFFLDNDIASYYLGVCQDFKHFGFAVSVIILSRDGTKIVRTKSVRDEIIRGYLAEIYSAKRECLLTGSSGESAIAPPIKPSTISEAGKMAVSVLRKK